jgi:hypothetical protein
VTIQNGFLDYYGGGIYNGSTLTLQGVNISNNLVSIENFVMAGGAIYSTGILTITKSPMTGIRSTISNNISCSNVYALSGGINNTGTLTIKGNTLLSMNVALGEGAGSYGLGAAVYNEGTGTLTISNSTVANNIVRGGIGASGGAIVNDPNATCVITASTISNNTGSGGWCEGGAISNFGTLTVKGSTISNNSVFGMSSMGGHGGGVYLGSGTLVIQNASKIVKNLSSDLGGGLYFAGGGKTISSDSIVAKNIPDDIYPIP